MSSINDKINNIYIECNKAILKYPQEPTVWCCTSLEIARTTTVVDISPILSEHRIPHYNPYYNPVKDLKIA